MPEHAHPTKRRRSWEAFAKAVCTQIQLGLRCALTVKLLWAIFISTFMPFCWRCVLWGVCCHVFMSIFFLSCWPDTFIGRHSTGVWPTPLHKANKNKQTKPSSTLRAGLLVSVLVVFFFLTFIISRSWEAGDTRTLRAALLLCVTVFFECIVRSYLYVALCVLSVLQEGHANNKQHHGFH